MTKIPKFYTDRKIWFSTKLGGKTWTVYYASDLVAPDDKDIRLHGYCDMRAREIYIRQTEDTEFRLETLVHECVHAAFYEVGFKDIEEEVDRVSNAMFQLLFDCLKPPKPPWIPGKAAS